jgi:hypothetical protein
MGDNLDFLKPNQDDNEATSELKKATLKAVEDGDSEKLANIKLCAILSLVLKQGRKDKDFLDKAAESVNAALQLYRDSIIRETIKSFSDVPHEARELALVIGLQVVERKLAAGEKELEKDAADFEAFIGL